MISEIYPTLLQVGNKLDSHSWFSLFEHKNNSYVSPAKNKTLTTKFLKTIIIVLNFTENQKNIIDMWLFGCISIYNITRDYIVRRLTNENVKCMLNFYKIRNLLNGKINELCNKYEIPKHTADYSVKHCIEMYKSAFSNHKDVTKFKLKDLKYDRRRKNLVIEKESFSKKNNTFSSKLGDIETNIRMIKIKHNCVLQHDKFKNTYKLIVPVDDKMDFKVKREEKCGIDIGVRTFLTTYSKSETYEIGTNTYKTIDKYHKKIDNIRRADARGIIGKNEFEKINGKYYDKLKNKIQDMHNKIAKFLAMKYNTIIIGKVSTKKMVNNLTGNLKDVTKRRLMALAHYKFRKKLKEMGDKYNVTIIETDEYMTTKKCSNCKNIYNIGSEKTYNCKKCKLLIDRDINSAINIYLE